MRSRYENTYERALQSNRILDVLCRVMLPCPFFARIASSRQQQSVGDEDLLELRLERGQTRVVLLYARG